MSKLIDEIAERLSEIARRGGKVSKIVVGQDDFKELLHANGIGATHVNGLSLVSPILLGFPVYRSPEAHYLQIHED